MSKLFRSSLLIAGTLLALTCCEQEPRESVAVKVNPWSQEIEPAEMEILRVEMKSWLLEITREDFEGRVVEVDEGSQSDRLVLSVPKSRFEDLKVWIEAATLPDSYTTFGFREVAEPNPHGSGTSESGAWVELPMGSAAGKTYHVAANPICHVGDVADVQVIYGPSGWTISVTFTEEGSRKMAAFTTANVGRQLAIEIDGVITSMPMINEPFSSGAMITGDFDEATASRIADAIRKAPPAGFGPVPAEEAVPVPER